MIHRQYGDKPVLARVIRTGLWTNKGSLVVAILYPPPADFKFDRDSYKLVGILIAAAFAGFFYTLALMVGLLLDNNNSKPPRVKRTPKNAISNDYNQCYTSLFQVERGSSALNIAIKTLTVFTIVVPPALPSVMAVGKMYALFRLKARQIYCINTRAINISGSIDCVCFDKVTYNCSHLHLNVNKSAKPRLMHYYKWRPFSFDRLAL